MRRCSRRTGGRRGLRTDSRRPRGSGHFLPASLTFSLACLRSPFTFSALPLPSSLGLPTALPVPFLTLPLAASALPFAFSAALTAVPFAREHSNCPRGAASNIRPADQLQRAAAGQWRGCCCSERTVASPEPPPPDFRVVATTASRAPTGATSATKLAAARLPSATRDAANPTIRTATTTSGQSWR